jgi:AraC-like DNA-binding protein
VESLTINFNLQYQLEVARVILSGSDKLMDDPFATGKKMVVVEEKLFSYNESVSPLIYRIRQLTRNFQEKTSELTETLYLLLEAVLLANAELDKEIRKIDAIKLSTKKEMYRRLNEIKDYIDSCCNEDITLDSLSKIALMSPFHLLRQFKKNFHITPHQYLISRRLDRAKNKIVHSGDTIKDICLMTGFRDISSFTKLFKHKFGVSPQQYRTIIKG